MLSTLPVSAEHQEVEMTADLAVVAVYLPPKEGLPYLAVAITPDGKVHGVTADTAAEAQALVATFSPSWRKPYESGADNGAPLCRVRTLARSHAAEFVDHFSSLSAAHSSWAISMAMRAMLRKSVASTAALAARISIAIS